MRDAGAHGDGGGVHVAEAVAGGDEIGGLRGLNEAVMQPAEAPVFAGIVDEFRRHRMLRLLKFPGPSARAAGP